MIWSNRGPSSCLLLGGWAPLFAALLSACGAPAAPDAASPAGLSQYEHDARVVAQVALNSLKMRKIDINGCEAKAARYVEEAKARAGTKAGDKCSLLVAQRADKTWLVVVRAARRTGELEAASAQAGSIQAIVTVTAGGEGVTHIDYTP